VTTPEVLTAHVPRVLPRLAGFATASSERDKEGVKSYNNNKKELDVMFSNTTIHVQNKLEKDCTLSFVMSALQIKLNSEHTYLPPSPKLSPLLGWGCWRMGLCQASCLADS
jgi:hypothetical protein